jgi:hypothetical protein
MTYDPGHPEMQAMERTPELVTVSVYDNGDIAALNTTGAVMLYPADGRAPERIA